MRSFWKRQSCLLVAGLVAGGGGVFLELQSVSGAPAISGPSVASRAITAIDFAGPTFTVIAENGDGTAETNVGTLIGPTTFLGFVDFANPDYTVWVQPGQSGQGGSGTGHFTVNDVMAFNFATGMFVGPFDVSVDIAVTDATSFEAFVSQGVVAQLDPMTGETSVVRQHIIGSQASGDAAGSQYILVDDGTGQPGVVKDVTGVFGMAQLNSVHIVQQIH